MTTPSVWQSLSPRKRKLIIWAGALLLTYTLVGFVVLPFIIRRVAVKQLAKGLNREVAIESVRLNPYTFSVTIRGLKIKDPDAETLLAWDEVHVNFQLVSLVSHAWSFKEISVLNPYARVQMNQDRSLNFSDIIAAHTNTAPAKPAQPLALRVGHLRIEGARVSLADLTPRTPFRRIIGPMKVSITDFHTSPNNRNPHVLTGSTETGETFTWGGHFSTDPLGATGELEVENIALKKFAPLYEDFVNFEIRDGVMGFRVNYEFRMDQSANIISVSNTSLTLRSFKLATPGAADNLVELPEFTVTGVRGDLMAREVEVGAVAVRGAEFNLTREKNAPFNFATAAQPNAAAESAPGGILLLMSTVTNTLAQLLSSTNLATATVRDIAVQDCAVTLRDQEPGRPVRLRVDQIAVSAKNLSNHPDTNMLTSVSLRWNTNGTLRTELDAALHPLRADLHLKLDQIELAPLSPYLDSFVNAFVLGSKVNLDGTIRLRAEPGQLPSVTFDGSTGLDDLNLVSGSAQDDLLQWSSLRFDGIAANLNPAGVTVSNITVANIAAHVLIETNGEINVLSLVRPGDTNVASAILADVEPGILPGGTNVAPANASESQTTAAASSPIPGGMMPPSTAGQRPATTPAEGSAIQRAFAQVKTLLGMETNAMTGLPRVEINAITVTNAAFRFTDRSVTPPGQAAVTAVNATVQNLSTEEMRRAQVHVTALAGGTGPIEITGELNPLRAKEATELKLSLKHVKLNPADPYAGKFLGYRLTRGELNVDVQYTITASHVKGRNVIMLDQLTLGGKVASTNAINLPVKLGIALLKDSSGKIELDVPVEGNLDDPQFRIGKVVWGVIANMFMKAVTSPFSLLGSLVGSGGGEDMQFQEFAPGSAELDAATKEKLATLAKAMAARPELGLEIEGNVDPARDGDALRRAKLELHLRTLRWNSLRTSARETTTPEQVTLAPEERADLLAKAFRDALKTNAALAMTPPPSVSTNVATVPTATRPPTQSGKGATELIRRDRAVTLSAPTGTTTSGAATSKAGALTEDQMVQLLSQTFSVTDTEFAALAARRAENVRTELVQALQVAAERVLVAEGAYLTNGHRVTLQLR